MRHPAARVEALGDGDMAVIALPELAQKASLLASGGNVSESASKSALRPPE
jgi:hypothetical protein